MKLKQIALCLFMAMPALAGRVVTYTATSTVSQEDANNAAIAGVAKQISSQISIDQVIKKSETEGSGKGSFSQTYRSQSRVSSDVKLKGLDVKPIKVDNGYKATASIDLDVFTADLQLKLKTIQQEVSDLEETVRSAINDRHYYNAVKALDKARPLIKQHQKVLDQLGQIYPVTDSHRLHQDISKLETLLIDRLSKIKIEGPAQAFVLTKPEMPPWDVSVSDEFGPLPNFPLIAKQGRLTLSERRTQDRGTATFSLRNVNFSSGPYVVTVEPNLPAQFMKTAGLQNGIEISYSISDTKCFIKLQCNEVANICSAIEARLSKSSIFSSSSKDAIPLTVETSAQVKNTLGSLTSYNMIITLRGDGVYYSEAPKGAGKNEVDALVRSINKIDFSKLQKQLGNSCK